MPRTAYLNAQTCVPSCKRQWAQTYWPTYDKHIAVRPRNAWFRPGADHWGKTWYPIDARTSDGYCKDNDSTVPEPSVESVVT